MRAHCVDCGLPSHEMDLRTGEERCLPCKKKKLGREPREYTQEEVRSQVLDHVWHMIEYWLKEERQPAARQKLEGLAHSIFAMLDGSSVALPGFIVAPTGHPDNEEFHRSHHEDWFPYNSDKAQEAIKCDIGGSLHELFYTRRPEGWPKDDVTEFERPQPIRPPNLATPLDTFTVDALYKVMNHLQGTIGNFGIKAWPSITRYLLESTSKFHSGMFGDVKVMLVSATANALVTLWRGGKEVMLIGPVDRHNQSFMCGLQGISASAEEARSMVETVIKNWDADKLKRDDEVGVAWVKREKDIRDLYKDR